MKNWSENDTVFPVDFPVETKNRSNFRSRFLGRLEIMSVAAVMLVLIIFGIIAAGAVLVMIGAGLYQLWLTFQVHPLWTTAGTLIGVALYLVCCHYAAQEQERNE